MPTYTHTRARERRVYIQEQAGEEKEEKVENLSAYINLVAIVINAKGSLK